MEMMPLNNGMWLFRVEHGDEKCLFGVIFRPLCVFRVPSALMEQIFLQRFWEMCEKSVLGNV